MRKRVLFRRRLLAAVTGAVERRRVVVTVVADTHGDATARGRHDSLGRSRVPCTARTIRRLTRTIGSRKRPIQDRGIGQRAVVRLLIRLDAEADVAAILDPQYALAHVIDATRKASFGVDRALGIARGRRERAFALRRTRAAVIGITHRRLARWHQAITGAPEQVAAFIEAEWKRLS